MTAKGTPPPPLPIEMSVEHRASSLSTKNSSKSSLYSVYIPTQYIHHNQLPYPLQINRPLTPLN